MPDFGQFFQKQIKSPDPVQWSSPILTITPLQLSYYLFIHNCYFPTQLEDYLHVIPSKLHSNKLKLICLDIEIILHDKINKTM